MLTTQSTCSQSPPSPPVDAPCGSAGSGPEGGAGRKAGSLPEVSQKSLHPQHAAHHHPVLLLLLPLQRAGGQAQTGIQLVNWEDLGQLTQIS